MKVSLLLVLKFLVLMIITNLIFSKINLVFGQEIDPNLFITRWETTTENEEIEIPVDNSGFSYSYSVDWGDGTNESGLSGKAVHTYLSPGVYTVSISGNFPGIRMDLSNEANQLKIKSIEQWGSLQWRVLTWAFFQCENLEINANDSPDLSLLVNGLIGTFSDATALNSDLNNWDVSQVETFSRLFQGADRFNGELGNWDMSKAQEVHLMFYEAESFDKDISDWDMSEVVNMSQLFFGARSFNQPIGKWNTQQVEYLNGAFENAISFDQSLANWNVSKVTSMDRIFNGSGMSQANYDATLIGWATQNVQRNVTVGAEGLTFCEGKAARQKLIDEYGWTFVGDVLAESCQESDPNARPFQMEWNVAEGGTIIEFDLQAKNVTIEFGDGGSNYWEAISREGWLYSSPGNYTLSISGGLESISLVPGISYGNKFLRIVQWGDIEWKNMENMFNGSQVQFDLSQVDTPDLGQVTSLAAMFKDAQFDENLGNWDISTITDMRDIFSGSSLSPQNYDATLIGWAAQEVQRNVVVGAAGLVFCEGKAARQKLIDEYGWRFEGDYEFCDHLTKRPFVLNIDVGTDLQYFEEGSHTFDVGTENVLANIGGDNYSFLPSGGQIRVSLDFPYYTTYFSIWGAEWVNLGDPFDITSISQWGDSEWTDMEGMFVGHHFGISAQDTPVLTRVTSLADMFNSSEVSIDQGILQDWDVSNVQNLARMFKNYRVDTDLGSWDIGNVTDMTEIFSGSSMSQENYDATLIGWSAQEVQRNVTVGAEGLTFCEGEAARQKLIDEYGWTFVGDQLAESCQEDLGQPFVMTWLQSGAVDPEDPFIHLGLTGKDFYINWFAADHPMYHTPGEPYQTTWTGEYVDYLEEAGYYDLRKFYNGHTTRTIAISKGLGQLNLFNGGTVPSHIHHINQWGEVEWESLEGLFKSMIGPDDTYGIPMLEILAEDAPNLSNATSMKEMFSHTDFAGTISHWNVSTILDMSGMFLNSNFDQSLASWNISNVSDMTDIFSGSSLSQQNYDATLIGWAAQEVQANVTVGAEGLTFCEGKAARQKLIDEYGWTFVGDQLAEGCQDVDPEAFVMIWETTGLTEEIYIPTADPNFAYNYTVDWGDGTVEEGLTGRGTHRYFNPGRYTVSITGQFPKTWFYISSTGNKVKLKEVKQWGSIKWEDMQEAFYESGQLDISATDAPDLSDAFTTYSAFQSTGLTTPDLNHWDVSTIIDFENMFSRSEFFNGRIDQWDMSNAVNISYMFSGATSFNQPIGDWQFDNLEYLYGVFEGATAFDQSLADWNISKALSMEGIFDGSGMSHENYDATLIGWAAQNVQPNVTVGAEGLVYCAGKAARQKLIDEYGWTFVGDSEATDCKDLITGITFEDETFSYDGTLKTIVVSGEIPDGVTITYENNTGTEVGSQTATAYLDGGDLYEDLTLTATLTILEAESPTAKASDIQLENRQVCSAEMVTLEASSGTVSNPVFRFYRDEDLTQIIESDQIQVFEDTQVYVTVSGDGVNENLPGEAAVLQIEVNWVEAPVFLETTQEFCAEDSPTLHDLVVEPIIPGAILNYYPSLESTEALDGDTALESKTYYAEVYDAVNGCGSARVPITAEVKTCNPEPGEKLPIEGISFQDVTYTYDGTEKSLTISGALPTGVSVSYENNTRTEIGSQTASAYLDGGESYEDLTLTALLTIVEGELPTAKTSDIEVTDLEVCPGEIIELTASSLTVNNPVFTYYLDAQLTQQIDEDQIQIFDDSQIFVTVKGNGIQENLPGEAAVLQITVRTVEPPVFSLFTQEFCQEDQPTIAEIEVQGVGEGKILRYFSSWDASDPLPTSSLLVSQTYYAELLDEASNCSSERVAVVVEVTDCQQSTADFTIEKSADVTVVFPGELIVYTILVRNNSDQLIDRLVVADNLEENLDFLEADQGGELDENKVVHWNLANLEAGQTISLKLTTQVKETAVADVMIRNQAHVINPDLPDQYKDSNVTETRVEENPEEPVATIVTVEKSQDQEGAIEPGTVVTYSILVSNTGESPALGLVVRDVISEGGLVANISGNGLLEENQVVWQIEKLDPGESIELQLELIIHLPSGTFSNSVFVGGENFEEVSDQTSPLVMIPIEEENPVDLRIELLGNLSTVLVSTEYEYEILISNWGPNRANEVEVSHTLSEWVEVIDVSPAKGSSTLDPETGEILWHTEGIDPGESITMKVRLKASGPGLIESHAAVGSQDFDIDILNNNLLITYAQIGLLIPNVFTPNGDGINETWDLEGLQEVFSSNQLVVFDRMGKVVYSMENYQNDWGGSGLARGTYFYELQGIDYQGANHNYTGFVTIIY